MEKDTSQKNYAIHYRRPLRAPRCLTAFLVMLLLAAMAVTAYAETTQEDIDNAKSQITDIQQQKQDAEDQVDSIQSEVDSLSTDLSSLNSQLSSLTSSINDLEGQISDKEDEIAAKEDEIAAKEADIEQAKADLADAQDAIAEQYEAMKLRIQYMYEYGTASEWEMLLESDSFADFLNRVEYFGSLTSYDRSLLEDYEEAGEQIAAQEAALEEQLAELDAERDELDEQRGELVAMNDEMGQKKSSVDSLISGTRANISTKQGELSNAQDDVDALEAQLAQMIAYEQELEIQKAKEDAARLSDIAAEEAEDTSGIVVEATDSDLYLLGAIIQCEADGEPYEGKLAVGRVVINRVKSSYFPNTISGVIYQSGQFSPVASGRLALRLEEGVNSTCMSAAQEVLNGNITVDCLYFRTNNGLIDGIVIGNHVFY